MNIQEIDESDYSKVVNIVKEGLGETYANNVESLEKEDNVLLTAKENGEIVGFACGYNSDNPEEYVDNFNEETPAKSILEKVVVREGYRGKGIGSKLTEERLNRLEQPTLAEAWMRTGEPDSTIILENFGFELLKRIENAWYEESIEEEDEEFCPDCGKICECNSGIYILKEKY